MPDYQIINPNYLDNVTISELVIIMCMCVHTQLHSETLPNLLLLYGNADLASQACTHGTSSIQSRSFGVTFLRHLQVCKLPSSMVQQKIIDLYGAHWIFTNSDLLDPSWAEQCGGTTVNQPQTSAMPEGFHSLCTLSLHFSLIVVPLPQKCHTGQLMPEPMISVWTRVCMKVSIYLHAKLPCYCKQIVLFDFLVTFFWCIR